MVPFSAASRVIEDALPYSSEPRMAFATALVDFHRTTALPLYSPRTEENHGDQLSAS
jgi:hypothetical protein